MGKNDPKLPPDTAEAKALAEVAALRFNRYQEVFVPLENQYMQEVFDVRDQGAYETVGGLAASGYQQEFARANDQLATEMIQQGVDPGSGVFVGQSSALRKAQAKRQGMGVADAKVGNTDRFYSGLQGLIAMGQGQAGEAIGGMQDMARSAGERAMQDAQTSFQSASGMRAGVGTFVGLGVSPWVDKAAGNAVKKPSTTPMPAGGG